MNPGQSVTPPWRHNEPDATKGEQVYSTRMLRDTPGTDEHMCCKEGRQEGENHLHALERCLHACTLLNKCSSNINVQYESPEARIKMYILPWQLRGGPEILPPSQAPCRCWSYCCKDHIVRSENIAPPLLRSLAKRRNEKNTEIR